MPDPFLPIKPIKIESMMTLYLKIGKLVTMRIIGIDPGLAIIGFGIIDIINNKMNVVSYGAITTPANTLVKRTTIKHNIQSLQF